VTFSLEHFPTAYDGALSECGVVSGVEELNYFVSWAALAQYFTGVQFIGGASSPQEMQSIISTRVLPALGPVDAPSQAGQEFADAIMHLTGGPRPLFQEGLATTFDANFNIIAHALELAGPSSAAGGNTETLYAPGPGSVSAEQLNRDIDRFAPADLVAADLQPMTGRIQRPLLTLHNTGDLFVPIGLEQSYRTKVEQAGSADLLVQRAVRREGHCNFTMEERARAFDDLVTWVEQGLRPEGEDLSGELRQAGLRFTSPLQVHDASVQP
jgi:hypothetical protein